MCFTKHGPTLEEASAYVAMMQFPWATCEKECINDQSVKNVVVLPGVLSSSVRLPTEDKGLVFFVSGLCSKFC